MILSISQPAYLTWLGLFSRIKMSDVHVFLDDVQIERNTKNSFTNRNKLRKLLEEKNIETGTHYKPIHTFTLYKKNFSLPITEKISNEIVTIPIHPNLKSHQIDKIISTINKSI